jgi:hypothetical protein
VSEFGRAKGGITGKGKPRTYPPDEGIEKNLRRLENPVFLPQKDFDQRG